MEINKTNKIISSIFSKHAKITVCRLSTFAFFFAFLSVAQADWGGGVNLPQNTGLSEKSIPEILAGLVSWLLLIFGFVAIISFVITGIMYLTARGDDKTAETAKKQLTYSIIGVIVGLSGYIVLKAIDAWLKGSAAF